MKSTHCSGSILCLNNKKEQSGDCGCMWGGWVLRGLVVPAPMCKRPLVVVGLVLLLLMDYKCLPKETNGVLGGGNWWQSLLCLSSPGCHAVPWWRATDFHWLVEQPTAALFFFRTAWQKYKSRGCKLCVRDLYYSGSMFVERAFCFGSNHIRNIVVIGGFVDATDFQWLTRFLNLNHWFFLCTSDVSW